LGVITWSINLALRYGGCYAQIEELVVDAAKRGTGAGAALVREAIARARAAGCAEIGLYALEHNRPFYEKLGFVYAGPELRQPLDG
jgi:GNAT superfamily N-acetyltransferase